MFVVWFPPTVTRAFVCVFVHIVYMNVCVCVCVCVFAHMCVDTSDLNVILMQGCCWDTMVSLVYFKLKPFIPSLSLIKIGSLTMI